MQQLRDRWQKLSIQLPYLPQALHLVWRAAPRWTIAWGLLLIIQGLLPVATVYLTRALVDNMVAILGVGFDWATARPTIFLAGLMAALLLLTEVTRSFFNWIRTAQTEQVKDYISDLIHAKSSQLDMAFYETPDYYDKLYRASQEASYRPINLLENLGTTIQNGITLVAMAGVLMTYTVWLPLVLLISTLPVLLVLLRHTLRYHEWRLRTTVQQRRSSYYNWLLTGRETAAELRLFNLSDHFREQFQTTRQELRQGQLQLTRDQGAAELAAGGFGLLITAVTLAWMLWQAFQGVYSLGDLTLFYQAFNQGQRLTRNLLQQMSQIYSNSIFLSDLFAFLNLEYAITDPPTPQPIPQPWQQGIQLHDVSFHYPGSQRTALDKFNLALPSGQIVAIVGANGAGKSTLIKLLCRFYDPDAGHICLDGIDLRQVGLHEWRRQVTVLFQQPVHYSATAAHNIRLGDLAADASQAEVEAAARAAGADEPIQRLSQGYETVLGKWFGGGELSVGEWQRLALARAFLRRAQLIILDEPTSAMDSWAEADWLGRFRQMVAGRTALIITHRFTTALQADIIHVMERGQVVESGTHEELLAQNGRYAQSWRQQMQEE